MAWFVGQLQINFPGKILKFSVIAFTFAGTKLALDKGHCAGISYFNYIVFVIL